MSYCRFAWDGSDVYVYESNRGIECCGCALNDAGFIADSDRPEDMIAHLAEHRRAGHVVPFHAIEGLWGEIPGQAHGPESPVLTLASLQLCVAEMEQRAKEADRG